MHRSEVFPDMDDLPEVQVNDEPDDIFRLAILTRQLDITNH